MTTCARNRNVRELPPRKPHSSHRHHRSPPVFAAHRIIPMLVTYFPFITCSRPHTPRWAHGTSGCARGVPLKQWKKARLSRSEARLRRVCSTPRLGSEFSTSARRSTSLKRRVRSRFTGRVSNASIASSTLCRKSSANLVSSCSAPYVCRANSADVSSNSADSTKFSRGASPQFQSDEARQNLRDSVVPQSGCARSARW